MHDYFFLLLIMTIYVIILFDILSTYRYNMNYIWSPLYQILTPQFKLLLHFQLHYRNYSGLIRRSNCLILPITSFKIISKRYSAIFKRSTPCKSIWTLIQKNAFFQDCDFFLKFVNLSMSILIKVLATFYYNQSSYDILKAKAILTIFSTTKDQSK